MRYVVHWVGAAGKIKKDFVSTWWQTERMLVAADGLKSVTVNRADVSDRVCPNLVGGNSPAKTEQSTKRVQLLSSENNPTAF